MSDQLRKSLGISSGGKGAINKKLQSEGALSVEDLIKNPAFAEELIRKSRSAGELLVPVSGLDATGPARSAHDLWMQNVDTEARFKNIVEPLRKLRDAQEAALEKKIKATAPPQTGGGGTISPIAPEKPPATPSGSGLPAGAKQIGTSQGKPVYQLPDGKHWME